MLAPPVVVALCTVKALFDKMLSNIKEVKARGAVVIAVAEEGHTEIEKEADHVIYIPKSDSLVLPSETVVPLQLFAYYIASFIDVTAPKISFVKKKSESKIAVVFKIIAGAVLSAGFLFDIYKVFSLLQDPDTGDFDITQISNVNWILVCIVTGAAVVIALASVLIGKAISGKTKNQ